jgi:hypothetical protein
VKSTSASRDEASDEQQRDEQALAFRKEGRSFGKIATLLGFENSRDAVTAYRRAADLRPAAERATLRATEKKRFDAMARAVRADTDLTKADAAKRLARIERLRALVG